MKTLKTFAVTLMILLIAGASFWLGIKVQSKKDKAENSKSTVGIEIQPGKKISETNWEKFDYDGGKLSFEYPQEWIKIPPEEIEKRIPAELRAQSKLIFYSSNPEMVMLTASVTRFPAGTMTMEKYAEDEKTKVKKIDANSEITREETAADYALLGFRLRTQGIEFGAENKTILVKGEGEDVFYAVTLNFPWELREKYSEISGHIIESAKANY